MSCHNICIVRDFSSKNYSVFIVNANKRTSSTMPFGYGKLKMKRPEKGIPPRRKREVKKYEQTVSADLKEEQIVVAPSSIFYVNQHLK